MPSNNYQRYKDYYHNYYLENREKNLQRYREYNKTRPSKRQNYVGIEINGQTYCFPSKNKINFIKLTKTEIDNNDNIHICV